MEKKFFLLIAFFLMSFISYVDMRILLWSIVQCDKHKSGKNWRKYKAKLQDGKSLRQKISMHYLLDSVEGYRKEFLFWLHCKRLFVVLETVFVICYIVYSCITGWADVGHMVDYLLIGQACVSFLVMRFQFGAGGHQSKYDRLRRCPGGGR